VLKVEQNRKQGSGRQRNDRLFLAPLEAAHGDAPKDVLAFAPRLRSELEDFFVWSTRWEKKDLRFLGWGGIDEAETILSAAERAARGGAR
jgi:inorganic pyrophosphatase